MARRRLGAAKLSTTIWRIPMSAPGGLAEKTGRLSLLCKRRQVGIARAEVIIAFLALIRTLTAGYQVKAYPGNTLPAGQVGPIITGSLVAAAFCLALTLLSLVGRYRVMHAVFVLAIASLVLVKIFVFPG
jgi:hypothetical protein